MQTTFPAHWKSWPILALSLGLAISTAWPLGTLHAQATPKTPQEILTLSVGKLVGLVEPQPGAPAETVSATVRVAQADGSLQALGGRQFKVAFQAPDRLRVSAEVAGIPLQLGRLGNQLWIYAPTKQFGLVGSAKVPRFATEPDRPDGTVLPPLKLPLPRSQMLLFPLLFHVVAVTNSIEEGVPCRVLRATPLPQAREALKLPDLTFEVWVRDTDLMPVRLRILNPAGHALDLVFQNLRVSAPWPEARWRLTAPTGAHVQTVALSHLTRFVTGALSLLRQNIPTLGPATGKRRLIATEGKGRLENWDGTRVLFLKGTPEEMGHQQGVLLRAQVRDLVNKVLYGVGVGSSFAQGRWFFGQIESAERRELPFMAPRDLREMDALADASGNDREEIRLANFFPELFHCSGFAVFGRATADGRLYHGRILDYMRGMGLEPNAVVIVNQPDQGYAWVNVGYAGFIGSVTAMNAKHISMGEMGGRGEGNWDGKPMAELVRDVMEHAATLDQAIAIMRRGPRTCEYYYVISDGNTRRAVGVAATPTTFELVHPGEANHRLPHAIPDAVVLSAGDRYETLVARVKRQYGHLDAVSARHLMDPPVCMKSNLHSVLFAPETLDFWVANADSQHVASECRYTHYNLGKLLHAAPAPALPPRATTAQTAPQ